MNNMTFNYKYSNFDNIIYEIMFEMTKFSEFTLSMINDAKYSVNEWQCV